MLFYIFTGDYKWTKWILVVAKERNDKINAINFIFSKMFLKSKFDAYFI